MSQDDAHPMDSPMDSPTDSPIDLPVIELNGSPRRMGEAFGEQCRDPIRELYALRMQAAVDFGREHGRELTEAQVLGTCARCLAPTRNYDPPGHVESAAIARAAGLTAEQHYALQGLTDLRDLLGFVAVPDGTGCSSAIVAPDRALAGELLLGQTWDLHTDNMPFVRLVHRVPTDGPDTWSLTLTGCLTMIGVNGEGLAVGTTNLQTSDARAGVHYLSVLHRALRTRTLDQAVAAIRAAPRAGAHYYYAAAPDGRAAGLECSARTAVVEAVDRGIRVRCNHALSPAIAGLQAEAPTDSSRHRHTRLEHLLCAAAAPIGVDDLKRFFADHEGGETRCICRHDVAGVSTNAAVIMCPATREIHACRAQPHIGRWVMRTAGAAPGPRP